MTTEQERLRREMRAMAAVNRQLQALREEPVGVRKSRRNGVGIEWTEELLALGECDARLARSTSGAVFVIEGDRKRAIRSGILAAALEPLLGTPTDVSDTELEGMTDSAPVELLEASSGIPFVIVGGRRYGATGVPLTYPVGDLQASEFPEADELNVAAANISRRRFEEALTGQFQISRARGALSNKGVGGTVKAIGRRAKRLLAR